MKLCSALVQTLQKSEQASKEGRNSEVDTLPLKNESRCSEAQVKGTIQVAVKRKLGSVEMPQLRAAEGEATWRGNLIVVSILSNI